MTIRKARIEDIDSILEIYLAAKQFMQATGNKKQLASEYPSEALIIKDIKDEKQYICIYESRIAGTFYFNVEEDKTYAEIYEGKWLNDRPYGVIHRLASNGTGKGIAHFCLQWCFNQCNNIRVDTHKDNTIMQNILKRNGYQQCGVIFVQDGTERFAYQKS